MPSPARATSPLPQPRAPRRPPAPTTQEAAAARSAEALLREATALLVPRAGSLSSARLEAELLLAHALGVRRERLLTVAEVSEPAAVRLLHAAAERARTGRPVAYLVGRRAFLEFDLDVDPRVLVPRPETELLIESLDELLATGALPPGPIVDRGTGSGNLALGVRGRRAVLALDLSADALDVARLNLARLLPAARILPVHADGLACLRPGSVAAVLANPPYIEPHEHPQLPDDVRHEPREALVPNEGSTRAMFTRLLAESRAALVPHGFLLSEIGTTQAAMVTELASVLGFTWTEVRSDLAGHDRLVIARR